MSRVFRMFAGGCLVVAFFLQMTGRSAYSLPLDTAQLRLTSGGTVVTIKDNQTGTVEDEDSTEGLIVYSGAVGVFTTNVATGVTKPVIGSEYQPQMDFLSVDISGGGSGRIIVEFTATDFLLPLTDWISGFELSLGGTTYGGELSSTSVYIDSSNEAFGRGLGGPVVSLGSYSGGSFSGSVTTTTLPTASPYSITMVTEITHTGASQFTSFDASFTPVPEPASLILMGSGLVSLGIFSWRRKRKNS